ncbi:MAG: MBOAT family protein [Clostridia bacterium]|nr:MBOAT family protein [Clostridia bacterium]MBQ7095797.1 MBOAT family protein [Clostridia bacterium]
MSFNSVIFIFFFLPIVLIGNFLLRNKPTGKKTWLLLAGVVFYGYCNLRILAFLIVYGLIHYWFGCLLESCNDRKIARNYLLIPGILLDVFCLFVFKYLNYALSLGNRLFGTTFPAVANLILPLGISFLSFSMIAYLVDIYREKSSALKSPVDFFLYLSFFPKVSQGPITRHGDMPEISRGGNQTSITTFASGLRRFIAGFGKKVLIADILGNSVDMVWDNISSGLSSATAWMGILCYTLQIYYDFSGYTDMAIGLAKMLGFSLPENFNFPYLSRSVSEFWRRWHITLGNWFKEYIYFPLGGSRKGMVRTIINSTVVWLFTGIWHGAATNFVLWGIYFGFFVILEKFVNKKLWYQKIPEILKWAFTFFLVMMGWIIFRSNSLDEIVAYIQYMFASCQDAVYEFGYFFDNSVYIALFAGILLTLPRPHKIIAQASDKPIVIIVRDLLLFCVLLLSIIFMLNSTYQSFIYFQF